MSDISGDSVLNDNARPGNHHEDVTERPNDPPVIAPGYTLHTINKKISEVVGVMLPFKGSRGPVRTLVEAVSFDRIYLLSNYPKDITQLFLGWLGRETEARYTSLSNPTD